MTTTYQDLHPYRASLSRALICLVRSCNPHIRCDDGDALKQAPPLHGPSSMDSVACRWAGLSNEILFYIELVSRALSFAWPGQVATRTKRCNNGDALKQAPSLHGPSSMDFCCLTLCCNLLVMRSSSISSWSPALIDVGGLEMSDSTLDNTAMELDRNKTPCHMDQAYWNLLLVTVLTSPSKEIVICIELVSRAR